MGRGCSTSGIDRCTPPYIVGPAFVPLAFHSLLELVAISLGSTLRSVTLL